MESFNYNAETRTCTIVFTKAEVLVFEDKFIGGTLEGVESVLSQNVRQRTNNMADEIISSALKNGAPLSFVSKDDLIMQHAAKPEYKNAAARYEEEQERIAAEQAAAAVE